jgi:hypothetical protein
MVKEFGEVTEKAISEKSDGDIIPVYKTMYDALYGANNAKEIVLTADEVKLVVWCVEVAQGVSARKGFDEKYHLIEQLLEKVRKM